MNPARILITGGTGWVGGTLIPALRGQGHDIIAAIRSNGDIPGVRSVKINAIRDWQGWSDSLSDRQVVLHLAARVHVMRETASHPLQAFRETNTAATLHLARQAATAGVRRFIFVSSVKVNGECTVAGQPFTAADAPSPQDPYGISKMEAEHGLRQIAAETGMEVVIVRPPLVYGPGVKANFASLMRAVQRGIPLPLASVTNNRRSFVALDNLVDLLITCLDHHAAANQTFLVSDGEDLSTADLLLRLGRAMGKQARLFPVPPSLLQLGANILGKGDMAQRLLGNLQVDIGHTRNTLNWSPPISVDEGLRRATAGLKQ